MACNLHWPLFDLQVTTERLTLRVPSDDDLAELADRAKAGVHNPSTMPFAVPWTDLPSPDLERSVLRYHWGCRAAFSPVKWDLNFVVVHDGAIVGMQGLSAESFLVLRSVGTGSWLGLDHQNRGIGKEMRAAAVRFAFDCLGAQQITSGAFAENLASQRVSLSTGYEETGRELLVRRGVAAEQIRFTLTRERWEKTRAAAPFNVSGFEGCRSFFGL